MGYMTVITILNDAWGGIKENTQEFVDVIEKGMIHPDKVSYHGIKNYGDPVIVARSQHADIPQLVLAQYNEMTDLGPGRNYTTVTEAIQYKNRIETASRIIKSAKKDLLDFVCMQIVKQIKNDNLDIKELSKENIRYYIKESECRKQLDLKEKKILQQLKKYYL